MPDPDLALYLDRFVRRLHAMLHAKALEFDTARVGPGGAIVLLTLSDLEPADMHRLTEVVNRDKSQMTRTIRSLETKGMIVRQTSDRDARVSVLSLTDAGHKLVAAHRAAVSDCLDEILAPLPAADRRKLRELLQLAAS